MNSCTVAEVMGLAKHGDNISSNELSWWVARSTMKPLPAVREQLFFRDLTTISNIHQDTGKEIFKEKSFRRDWFAIPEEDEWAEAKKNATKEQKIINESLKNG